MWKIAASLNRAVWAAHEFTREAESSAIVTTGRDRSNVNSDTIPDMNRAPFQFSIGGILWAIVWIGIGLATIPLFDAASFLDDDGDNVVPRMLAAFWGVLAIGAFGSLRGRPIAWAARALVIWIPVCVVILLMAVLPGLL